MALRRDGQDEEAIKLLDEIKPEMEIIENMAYHRSCLFYKGLISEEDLAGNQVARREVTLDEPIKLEGTRTVRPNMSVSFNYSADSKSSEITFVSR